MFTVGMSDDMVADMLRAPSTSRTARDVDKSGSRRVAESRSPSATFKTTKKTSPHVDCADGHDGGVPLGDMVGSLNLQVFIRTTHTSLRLGRKMSVTNDLIWRHNIHSFIRFVSSILNSIACARSIVLFPRQDGGEDTPSRVEEDNNHNDASVAHKSRLSRPPMRQLHFDDGAGNAVGRGRAGEGPARAQTGRGLSPEGSAVDGSAYTAVLGGVLSCDAFGVNRNEDSLAMSGRDTSRTTPTSAPPSRSGECEASYAYTNTMFGLEGAPFAPEVRSRGGSAPISSPLQVEDASSRGGVDVDEEVVSRAPAE